MFVTDINLFWNKNKFAKKIEKLQKLYQTTQTVYNRSGNNRKLESIVNKNLFESDPLSLGKIIYKL